MEIVLFTAGTLFIATGFLVIITSIDREDKTKKKPKLNSAKLKNKKSPAVKTTV